MKEKQTIECMLESVETVGKVDHTTIYKVTLRLNSDNWMTLPYFGHINSHDLEKMTGNPIKYRKYETGFWITKRVHQELIGSGFHYHHAQYKSDLKRLQQPYRCTI